MPIKSLSEGRKERTLYPAHVTQPLPIPRSTPVRAWDRKIRHLRARIENLVWDKKRRARRDDPLAISRAPSAIKPSRGVRSKEEAAKKKMEGTVENGRRGGRGSRWSWRLVYQHISKISLLTLLGETPAEPSAIITIRYDYAIIVTQPTRRQGKITLVNWDTVFTSSKVAA